MITNLTIIPNDILKINNNDNIMQIDIKTIVKNAILDKKFYKLLNLCISYNIHLFNQYNNICILSSIENLILQLEHIKKQLIHKLANKIDEISNKDSDKTWILDINNIYLQYQLKFKEIEIIDYFFKNIYDDNKLEQLCCISVTTTTSSITNNKQNNQTKKQIKLKIERKEKLSKYIAIYSN